MAIADQTPVICSAGVASPCGLELLGGRRRPGEPRDPHVPHGGGLPAASSATSSHNGERLLCQHVHDEDEVPAEACLVAPGLLRYLNNKANLPAIVGRGGRAAAHADQPRGRRHAARRRVVGPQGLLRRVLRRRIRGVRPPGGRARSRGRASCSRAPSSSSRSTSTSSRTGACTSASRRSARRGCIGATEQIISATGAYGGSRVGGTVLPAAAAELCQAVAERARELGFIGYCGIDTGLTSSGELRVFDLNFRINASTPPLLVLNAIAASRGPSWEGRGRWQTYRHDGSLPDLVKRLDAVYPDGALVPIASYDPAFTANGPGTVAAVGAAARRRRAGPAAS